eukprot:TRINITY_DN31127_c0_g1_i1.p2 TRINITY_DN31127_c0_g1~~TRINITY_DN31127_c0_g1_i1.p2  ORF type:complete len:223 (+),score=8.92 TRINITY_DN31127_c0_g1_i1:32-700(+)
MCRSAVVLGDAGCVKPTPTTVVIYLFFFLNDTATTEIYTLHIVGSVRCVQETGVEHLIDLVLVEEIVRIVKRDKQDDLLFYQVPGHGIEDLFERRAGRGGQVPDKFPVNLGDDCELGVVDLAVDIDRHEFLCRLLDLLEEFPDTRGLSRAGKSLADAVHGPAAANSGLDLECQFAHLVIPEFELLRNVIDLQYLRVPEQRLVPHQQVLLHLITPLRDRQQLH